MLNVALVGVGNCASALVQGVEYYKRKPAEAIGVSRKIGSYVINDIQFVVGFDVNKKKVGKDISQAIFVEPNCANFLYKPKNPSC